MKKLLLVLSLVSVLFVTGCTPKDEANQGDGTPANASVVLSLWTTEQGKFFESLAREFAGEIGAPNLRFKILTFPDNQTLQATLLDQLAEGEGPDIIYTTGEWLQRNSGKLTAASTGEGFTPENFRNTFVQSASDTLILGDQHIIGVPLAVDSLALLFNDEHIADRLPDRNLPARTWDDLREDAATLSKKDNSFERFAVSGVALGRTDNLNYAPQILENLMLQSGVQFFDDGQTQALFHQTESVLAGGRKVNLGVEALNYFTSFADDRYKNQSWNAYLADSSSEGKDLRTFAAGKTSMAVAYARDLPKLQDLVADLKASGENYITDSNIRVAFLPQMEDPSISPSRKVVGEVSALGVTRSTQYPDTAWSFLKFAIEKDNLQKWHEETLLPSPRVDMLVAQEQLPLIGTYVRQAKFARANLMPLPKQRFYDVLVPGIQGVNSGGISSNTALDTAARQLSEFLQESAKRAKALEIGNSRRP